MPFAFLDLYDYACWANERILLAAEGLTAVQWGEAHGHSFDSVHHTLVHILSSEELWLARWLGQSPSSRLTPEACATLDDLRTRWGSTRATLRAFVAGVTDWERVVAYTTFDLQARQYPLWQLYMQVINHGTHHRAEVATMLTEMKHAPAALDMVVFFTARGQGH